jgi:hypothetical protein
MSVGAAFFARPADACSVCGCGDPLVDARDSTPRMTRFRLAMDYEWLTASAASDDNPAATEGVTQNTVRPVIVYSPLESVNLVGQIPLIDKAFTLRGGGENLAATHTGLGDIDLGARWFFWSRVDFAALRRQEFGLLAGSSLPTGATGATLDGQRLDDHAQLGTGAWGPYSGLSYAFHRDPWNLFVSITERVHGTNSYDYHYGTSLQWSTLGDYRVVDWLALEFGVDGRYALEDRSGGEAQLNTGGLVLALVPGLTVNPWGDLWLRTRVQIPTVTVLNGVQSLGPTFFASAQILIH